MTPFATSPTLGRDLPGGGQHYAAARLPIQQAITGGCSGLLSGDRSVGLCAQLRRLKSANHRSIPVQHAEQFGEDKESVEVSVCLGDLPQERVSVAPGREPASLDKQVNADLLRPDGAPNNGESLGLPPQAVQAVQSVSSEVARFHGQKRSHGSLRGVEDVVRERANALRGQNHA